jgi:hypothetical protein
MKIVDGEWYRATYIAMLIKPQGETTSHELTSNSTRTSFSESPRHLLTSVEAVEILSQ